MIKATFTIKAHLLSVHHIDGFMQTIESQINFSYLYNLDLYTACQFSIIKVNIELKVIVPIAFSSPVAHLEAVFGCVCVCVCVCQMKSYIFLTIIPNFSFKYFRIY